MVTAMRRMSGHDLRAEVLTMIAKRDRALSEEFLAKLKSESDSSKEKSAPLPQDDWFVAEAVSKRIQVATALLKEGQTDKALEFAAPVLTSVNTQTINFLSELRTKNAEAAEAIRLAQTGKLSNTQRAAAYIDIANLLRDTERQKSLELIEEAVREANRIVGNKPDRAVLFVGIANQLMTVDRVRAWEIMGEVVKEANRVEGFTGEDVVRFSLMTGSGVRFQRIGGENFNLANVFRALAKDDLYRAVEVAKSFKYEAPRSTVTLAIASSILVREADGSIKPGAQAPGSQLIRKNTSPR
jgi:hypothetical protein